MKIDSEEMNGLLSERRQLTEQYKLKMISEGDFDMKLKGVAKKIAICTHDFLQKVRTVPDIIVEQKSEELNMTDEKIAKEVKVKAPKEAKPKKETRASLIMKALQMKTIKNADDVVKYVLTARPTDNASKVKAQTATMIKETVAKKKRQNFTWDEANYLMVENKQ